MGIVVYTCIEVFSWGLNCSSAGIIVSRQVVLDLVDILLRDFCLQNWPNFQYQQYTNNLKMSADPYKVVVQWNAESDKVPSLDVLELYFGGGKSGGGPIQDTQMYSEDGYATISFQQKGGRQLFVHYNSHFITTSLVWIDNVLSNQLHDFMYLWQIKTCTGSVATKNDGIY